MAQYDLLLTQNVHLTLIEYSERFVTMAKGVLVTANASNIPVALPVGTNGYVLMADSATASGLKWEALSAGHTQNTDIGTTSNIFELDTDGFQIELTAESASKFGVRVNGGATFADFEAKDATFNKVTVVTAPSAGTDLTNKTYVDGILGANDAMVFKGVINCSTNPNYPAADAGHTYKVSVAGKIGGASGPNVEIGDTLYCITDSTATGDHATVGANWTIVQANLDGVVIGPASAVDDRIATFDGITGKVIQDSGYAIADVVLKSLFDVHTILYATTDNTPVALTVTEQTIVGRITAGNVAALTAAQVMGILWQTAPATPTSTGTAGWIARDDDYIYVCTATNVWRRIPIATNWT